MNATQRIVILGSTGSIGSQALEVARWRGYEVIGLVAGKNTAVLLEQAREFRPRYVACEASCADTLRAQLPPEVELLVGDDSRERVASMDADVVVAAIPGMAGLQPTLAALRQGTRVALANKEAMVVAGPLVWEVARAHGAHIVPVDSEHSALFQCLLGEDKDEVAALVLTASGGPFRQKPESLEHVTPADALKHPTWTMGSKVTIDSATLFNKGLEVLEAHFLFEMALEYIEVVIHPQSLIHGLVRFRDGSIKAQIGPHDMRLPIQYGLSYPERPATVLEPLPLQGVWEFYPPDLARFPALALAYEAGRRGGTAPALLNAADEIAVEAFLAERIRFVDIPRLLEAVLEGVEVEALSWQSLQRADAQARALAKDCVGRYEQER